MGSSDWRAVPSFRSEPVPRSADAGQERDRQRVGMSDGLVQRIREEQIRRLRAQERDARSQLYPRSGLIEVSPRRSPTVPIDVEAKP
jgi:hypothetical protein